MATEIASSCWIERREVEGYDLPECTHPDCVNDDRSQYSSVWDGPYAACVYERWSTPCELPAGHDGPHVFEPSEHERAAGAAAGPGGGR